MLHGHAGPVNGVEADGTPFIEVDAAAAGPAVVSSKVLEGVLEPAAAAPEPAAAVAAFDPEATTCAAASQAVISPKSYSTAASQPAAVGPKLSSAASKLSADPKLSVAPSQPAADTTLLEVNTCMCICVACAALRGSCMACAHEGT